MKKIFFTLMALWFGALFLKAQHLERIQFTNDSLDSKCDFRYSDCATSVYLDSLRSLYDLTSITKNCSSHLEKAKKLMDWTHSRWRHNGWDQPEKSDAISILQEAEAGKNFRCVEYGIVLAAVLNSVGIPARVLGLRTKDVETRKSGAGHVVTEAYLPDLRKWILLDGQTNKIPIMKGIPLNAVELNLALNNHPKQVQFSNVYGICKGKTTRRYIDWIGQYLFYFNTSFDQSYDGEKMKCNGKSSMMLVPLGAKQPKIFQIKHKIDYCIYTNNVNDFYRIPCLQE